jgi:LmbE family N-acetylglucosaminyl deacetylase
MTDAHRAGFAARIDYAHARRREAKAALAIAGLGPDRILGLDIVDQDASNRLAELSRRMADAIMRLKPDIVLTHPYEGGHPDHDSAAFAVHAAYALLQRSGAKAPAIAEMASYHRGENGIAACVFLPDGMDEAVKRLSPDEQDRKRRMLACHGSQAGTLAPFPIDVERFRPAPAYDFTAPPQEGTLFYEMYNWGMDGPRWRALAQSALGALGLAP